MVAAALLREQLEPVRNGIDLETLIEKYLFKNNDQRLRLRELQILYRSVAKSLDGAIEMGTLQETERNVR